VVPGLPHHITQGGNRRQKTFFCDEDYQKTIGVSVIFLVSILACARKRA
jgi:hypothetical protein